MAEITVVGGINIDIEGSPFDKLMYQDSNPGRVSIAFGGVGRNITENIARMGGNVAMVSVIGDDQMGKGAKEDLANLGVDVSCIREMKDRSSAMYLSILDENRDMELAFCDMDIIEAITPEFLFENKDFIRQSKMIALDANLDEELIAYAAELFEGVPLFFDPVSSPKAVKVKNVVGKFHSIKPNIMEAEILTGIKIESQDDLKKAADHFINLGVKNVYITLNKDGVYYKNKDKEGVIKPKDGLKIVSATGAGDSFSASILMGYVKGMDIEETARMGMAAASIAMESNRAVSKEISFEEVQRRI